MKQAFLSVLLLYAASAAAQSGELPSAPSPVEKVQPIAIGLSAVERIVYQTGQPGPPGPATSTTVTYDFLPSLFINYRFDHNHFNANAALGGSSHTGNYSLTTSLSFNLFKLGHVGR